MSKLYNTEDDFTSAFCKFLKKACPNIRKTQLNIIPHIIWGMINSESSAATNIAKKFKGILSLNQPDSNIKRVRRFFNNQLFMPYDFWHNIIKYVINNYVKKHKNDKNVHIIIDHMFSHDNYTVLMFSMRIGKQGIPIWFRCFKGKPTDAFAESLIMKGISEVSAIFNNRFDLNFLADRWFNSTNLMKHIASLGHKYCFRLKKNIKVFIYDKKEGHKVWKWLDELTNYEWHSTCYQDVLLTDNKYQTSLVYSKRNGTNDPWILATNMPYKNAIKFYGYRFGGIETLFKNQKSNGLRIEAINNASEKYFTSMYTLVCTSVLYLMILGAEFSKNTRCYKNVTIKTHSGKERTVSLFKTGLELFNHAINSLKYVRLPIRFILYDI